MCRQRRNVFILLLFWSLAAVSKSNNPQLLPINLQADQGEYQADKGVATYLGNVVITQGEMRVTGDKVVIRLQNGRVDSIEAWGRPVTFHYLPNGQPAIDAQGWYVKYNVPRSTIEIDQQAEVRQGENVTRAKHLLYDLKKENVKGRGVSMTFQPKTK